MLIVDTREFRSKVVKELFNNDVDIQSLQLQVGDYLIGEDICIERKSVKDFVDSLIDKRIFEQLKLLKSEYKKPLLIVEGGESIYSVRKIHANAIRGLIASIIIDYGIPIFFSSDEVDTAHFIITLLKRMDKKSAPLLKIDKMILDSEVQESIVQSFPGVGVKASKKALSYFKTLKSFFNAGVNELLGVEGIGKKNAERIFEITNKEYKD